MKVQLKNLIEKYCLLHYFILIIIMEISKKNQRIHYAKSIKINN